MKSINQTGDKECIKGDSENSVVGIKYHATLKKALEKHKCRPPPSYLFMGIRDGPGLSLVASPAKSGKTILLENLVLALTLDRESFCGFPIPQGKKVLLVSCEEYAPTRLERNQKQISGLIAEEQNLDQALDRIIVINEEFPRQLRSKSEWDLLLKIVEEEEPGVLIIDSLSRMYSGAIESSETAQKVIQPLKNLSDNLGIPVIVIHHTTKMTGKELNMDAMAGSRMLAQECDSIIGIGKTKSGLRYLKPLAYRYADDTVDQVDVFTIDKNCLVKYHGKRNEEDVIKESDLRFNTENRDKILEYIEESCSVMIQDLKDKFVDTKKMSRSTLYENLHKLIDLNLIDKKSEGEYEAISCRQQDEEE